MKTFGREFKKSQVKAKQKALIKCDLKLLELKKVFEKVKDKMIQLIKQEWKRRKPKTLFF